MATTYPPDLWNVFAGTWGVNFQQDLAFFLTGPASLKFLNSAFGSPTTMLSDRIPFAAGDRVYGEAWVAADSNTAFYNLGFGVSWLDAAGGTISSANFWGGTVTTINTWEKKSSIVTAPALTAYATFYLYKADNPFSCWFDSVLFTHAVQNQHVDSAAAIVGTKLSAGAGVLSHLDNTTGVLDNVTSITSRSLDNITDGSTYARPLSAALSSGKVNLAAGSAGLANQLPNAQLGAAAVQSGNIAAAAVGVHQSLGSDTRTAINRNVNMMQTTRG